MKLASIILFVLSLCIWFVALIWWFVFYYFDVMYATGVFGKNDSLSDYFKCILTTFEPCGAFIKLARLGGGLPYHPIIAYLAIVLGSASAVTYSIAVSEKANAPTDR